MGNSHHGHSPKGGDIPIYTYTQQVYSDDELQDNGNSSSNEEDDRFNDDDTLNKEGKSPKIMIKGRKNKHRL